MGLSHEVERGQNCSVCFAQQRAVKLKEGKVQRELQHKRELERRAQQERMLEAKPATAK